MSQRDDELDEIIGAQKPGFRRASRQVPKAHSGSPDAPQQSRIPRMPTPPTPSLRRKAEEKDAPAGTSGDAGDLLKKYLGGSGGDGYATDLPSDARSEADASGRRHDLEFVEIVPEGEDEDLISSRKTIVVSRRRKKIIGEQG